MERLFTQVLKQYGTAKAKKLDEAYGQLAVEGFKWGSAWARYAQLSSGQWASFGFYANETAGFPHKQSFEANYDLSNKCKGFYGKPLLINYAHQLKFDNKTSAQFAFCFGKEWLCTSKYDFSYGAWKLSYTDKGDLKNFTKPN